MNKENFKQLATDMKSLINDMTEILKKHGVEKLASIVVSADGYFVCTTHKCEWEMCRLNEDAPVKIMSKAKAGFGEEL